jgi:GT2 family glycosyltransferase
MSAAPHHVSLSVVIPTLGGPSIVRTIEQLNRGTVTPMEILICIPEKEAPRTAGLSIPNVRVVVTPCRGQVAQRAYGFAQARGELVMQLDDDIFVRETAVADMIALMGDARNVAVGPKLYDVETGKYHAFLVPGALKRGWFESLMFWAVNGARGYQPGKIGLAGISMGVPEQPDNWSDLDWLPGGCVLHRRENLELTNYYPFKGKAYAEDLFHSELLRRKGVRLLRCGSAVCDVDFASNAQFDATGFFKWYRAYAKALAGVIDMRGGSRVFLYLYLILNLVLFALRKIRGRLTGK